MTTLTRGTTVLAPVLVAGLAVTRKSRSVVHDLLLTDSVEITSRPAGPRTSTLRLLWPTYAAASAAAAALAEPGGPWAVEGTADVAGLSLTVGVTGDVTVESTTDEAVSWWVTAGVTEVPA